MYKTLSVAERRSYVLYLLRKWRARIAPTFLEHEI